MEEVVRLHFLIFVDEIDSQDEEWGFVYGVDGDDEAQQNTTDEKDSSCLLIGDWVIFDLVGGQLGARVRSDRAHFLNF